MACCVFADGTGVIVSMPPERVSLIRSRTIVAKSEVEVLIRCGGTRLTTVCYTRAYIHNRGVLHIIIYYKSL